MGKPAPESNPVLGLEVFPDRYKVLGVFKQTAVVVAAFGKDSWTDTDVFLKAKDPAKDEMPWCAARIEHEAMALESLSHPQIPVLVDYGETDRKPYIITEFMGGKDPLYGRSTPKKAANIILQALAPLEYLHEQHIIHADFKPANLVMTKADVVALTDFELAHHVEPATPKDLGDSYLKRFIGTTLNGELTTPEYISPEQARHEKPSQLSDIYSVGISLYRLVAGKLPFQKKHNVTGLLMQHLNDEIDLNALDARGAPENLQQIVYRATRKRAGDRYQSAGEMAEDLERYLTS